MRTALMTVWAVAAIFAGAVGSSAGVLPLSYETLSYESGAITAVAEEQVVVAGPGVSDMLDAQPRTITSTPSSKMVDLSYAEVEAAFKRAPLVRNDHPEVRYVLHRGRGIFSFPTCFLHHLIFLFLPPDDKSSWPGRAAAASLSAGPPRQHGGHVHHH